MPGSSCTQLQGLRCCAQCSASQQWFQFVASRFGLLNLRRRCQFEYRSQRLERVSSPTVAIISFLTWYSIRFAAPPIGKNRWQAPQAPDFSRSTVSSAASYAPFCPQNPDASNKETAIPTTGASEDCLFLNVYSPNNASGPLPVLVWIHGGGYGAGNGREDLSSIINTNGNNFVGITIQYRVSRLPA
jgi:acetyl esterase/lipase